MTGWKLWPGHALQSPEFLAKLAAAAQQLDLDLDQYNNKEQDMNSWNTPNMYATDTDGMTTPVRDVRDAYIEQTEKQLEEATATATELHDTVTRLTTLNQQLRDNVNKLNSFHTEYREEVRAAIIAVHEAGDLDEQDTAELLDNLDLEGMMRTYTVTVTLSQQQEIEIEATSEDDAYEKVQEKGAYDLFNDEFGGCADYFDVEVNNVSAA